MKNLFLLLFTLLATSLHAQFVELWPTTYSALVSHQVNVGTALNPNWCVTDLDTIDLSDNTVTTIHSHFQTSGYAQGNRILTENRAFYFRGGAALYIPLGGENITYTYSKTGVQTATTNFISSANMNALVFFPSVIGIELAGTSSWRTITSASNVECRLTNLDTVSVITRIPAWWETGNGIDGGMFSAVTLPGQTITISISPEYFSTPGHPVSFAHLSFLDQIDDILP